MKKENTSFFSNLFGAKGKVSEQKSTTSVVLTSYSQPHVLRQRMNEEKMTHGETVMANISPVRLERSYKDEAVLYFCPMKKIEVLQITAGGDGGTLPPTATLDGLSVPEGYRPGLYRLCQVELTSNGAMQVRATANTRWELLEI